MSINVRFPRLSSDGRRIAAGHVDLYMGDNVEDMRLVALQASGPQWLTTNAVLCSKNAPNQPGDGSVILCEGSTITPFTSNSVEGWSCHNGPESFTSWLRTDRLKARSVSASGHIAGLVDLGDASILEVDGMRVDSGLIYEPRFTGDVLVWSKVEDGRRKTFGRLTPSSPTDPLSVLPADEFWPIAVVTSGFGVWVLNHSHEDKGWPCFLRPWGETTGFVVSFGVTDRPDVREASPGVFRIVFSDGAKLVEKTIDLNGQRVDLTKLQQPEPQEPVEDTSGQPINVFDYFIPSVSGAFPRTSGIPTHGHEMHVIFDGRNFYTAPFGVSGHFVRMIVEGALGARRLIFREDHSKDGQSTGDYSFTHGLWAVEVMKVGDRIVNAENCLVRYGATSCDVVDVHRFPFTTGLWKHWTAFDCGGDLGWQDVIAYLYDPVGNADTYELSYFAKGFGFFRWEEYNQRTGALNHWTTFNEFGGRAPQPTAGCWKREHLDLRPDGEQPEPEPKPEPKPETRLMVSFKTSDGVHFLCAEDGGGPENDRVGDRPKGLIVANRTDPGAWETFQIEKVDAGHIALKSANGFYVCAELGGGRELVANRTGIGAWETFEIVKVDGGVALKASNGQFVCAELGGGGQVIANRDGAGAWETFSTSQPITGGGTAGGGVPGDPGPGGALTFLGVSGRYFANASGLFDYRELTAFGAYARWLQGRRDQLAALASVSRAHKVTSWRVILTLSGQFWIDIGTPCGPSIAGFYEDLVPFTRWCAQQGIYVRYCLIGGIEEFGGHPVNRRDDYRPEVHARAMDYVDRVVHALAGEPNVLWNVANEWNQIGMSNSGHRVVEIGRRVKQIAPHHILSLTETNGPISDDPEWVREPADFVDAHLDRRTGMGGFEWVKRSSESPVVDNGRMPFLSGEPINFGTPAPGRPDDCERSPAVAFCYGGTSRVKRYLTTFHYHGGLTADVPDGDTLACLDGWRRGLDAIPLGFPGGWCNGHHGCSPWEIDNFPTSDSVDGHRGPVRIFGLAGSEGYIGVSVREVSGHRPRPRRGVQEVDRIEWGGYASAVYRA